MIFLGGFIQFPIIKTHTQPRDGPSRYQLTTFILNDGYTPCLWELPELDSPIHYMRYDK